MVIAGTPVEQWAVTLAQEALAPLTAQGVVVEMVVNATANVQMERIELAVQLFGRDGSIVFDSRFNVVWRQLRK